MRTALLFALITPLLATSCGKERPDGTDREPPTITLLSTAPPIAQGELCGGLSDRVIGLGIDGAMTISMRFADDVGLGSAKFDLHHNFDCHGHREGDEGQGSVIWNVLDIIELSGREQVVTRTFTPPQDVRAGLYHLGIQCLDALGKEAEWVLIDVRVVDPVDTMRPGITVDAPLNGARYAGAGPIPVQGTVTDDLDLGTGYLEISFITPDGIELSVSRIDFPPEAGTVAPFDLVYTVPSFVPRGASTLRLEAGDRRNNITVVERSLTLTD